jgi:hypothetical protein
MRGGYSFRDLGVDDTVISKFRIPTVFVWNNLLFGLCPSSYVENKIKIEIFRDRMVSHPQIKQ